MNLVSIETLANFSASKSFNYRPYEGTYNFKFSPRSFRSKIDNQIAHPQKCSKFYYKKFILTIVMAFLKYCDKSQSINYHELDNQIICVIFLLFSGHMSPPKVTSTTELRIE
jgi:hypothetical protein